MCFRPYRGNTYGEVLGNNPRYAGYLVEGGKRDNRKARFAHRFMAFMAETFFVDDREGMGNSTEGGSPNRWTGEMHQLERIRSSGILKVRENREKKWLANRESEPFEDPLLNRLMMGDWAAIDAMAEEIKKDEELVQEVTAMLQGLKERAHGRKTDDEAKRDAGNLLEIKRKMAKIKEHGRKRDELRESGMALTVIRTLAEQNEGRPEVNQDLQRLLNGDPIALEEQMMRNEQSRRPQ